MPTSRICCSDQPIFSKHVADQDSLRLGLLAVPPGRELVERIRETAGQDGGLSPHDLGALLRMPPRSLIEQYTQGESGRALRLQEEVALTALRENLPRALQWKAVVDLASELGLHRNHIQSQVEQFGKEGMLMLARNNIMYISPLGEMLVRERVAELGPIADLPSVSDVAQGLGISPNMAHAFFAKKRESLALDIHGRARLTPAQVEELEQWRASIDNIRARTDLTICGVPFRSVIRVAREKADLLYVPDTPAHAKACRRAEGTLRHFARVGKFARETEYGIYVPVSLAERFLDTISVVESARLLEVSTSTIKAWRRRHEKLAVDSIPGMKSKGVLLSELLRYGARQYDENCKLKGKKTVPAVFTALRLHDLAGRFGLDLDVLLSSWDMAEGVKAPLIAKEGGIPRHWHRFIEARLSSSVPGHSSLESLSRGLLKKWGPKEAVVSPEGVVRAVEYAASQRGADPNEIYQNARQHLKLSDPWPNDLLELKRDPEACPRFPLSLPCYLYLAASPQKQAFVYEQLNPGARLNRGDIVVHQGLHDIGFVTESETVSNVTRLKVSFLCADNEMTFELDI